MVAKVLEWWKAPCGEPWKDLALGSALGDDSRGQHSDKVRKQEMTRSKRGRPSIWSWMKDFQDLSGPFRIIASCLYGPHFILEKVKQNCQGDWREGQEGGESWEFFPFLLQVAHKLSGKLSDYHRMAWHVSVQCCRCWMPGNTYDPLHVSLHTLGQSL